MVAFFSTAAEEMRSDEQFSSNTYGRLCQKLEIGPIHGRFVDPSRDGLWREARSPAPIATRRAWIATG
jgi:hypothetical protein